MHIQSGNTALPRLAVEEPEECVPVLLLVPAVLFDFLDDILVECDAPVMLELPPAIDEWAVKVGPAVIVTSIQIKSLPVSVILVVVVFIASDPGISVLLATGIDVISNNPAVASQTAFVDLVIVQSTSLMSPSMPVVL